MHGRNGGEPAGGDLKTCNVYVFGETGRKWVPKFYLVRSLQAKKNSLFPICPFQAALRVSQSQSPSPMPSLSASASQSQKPSSSPSASDPPDSSSSPSASESPESSASPTPSPVPHGAHGKVHALNKTNTTPASDPNAQWLRKGR